MPRELGKIFEESFRVLRPCSAIPEVRVEFFAFANLNHTIRLRDGRLLVRISDLLKGAPESVLRAIAHILLAKIYRQPIEQKHARRYRRYIASQRICRLVLLVRQLRGRKRMFSPNGHVYNLHALFDDLNTRFFGQQLARPQMSWSTDQARWRLGHYDPAHNAIVVSRLFDHPRVPPYVIEYIVYHEMLHLKHPAKSCRGRRSVHSADFQAEEKLFPQLEAAKCFLKCL
ncbi:MAG: M48 family metallopeptidase [Acidobacteria bacterium]|nr:M48 family metallopeptidase [Acidobacteriota bacterium]MBV9623952.1 M48 family metallopeptidase [Acidobacteriota bacterium]